MRPIQNKYYLAAFLALFLVIQPHAMARDNPFEDNQTQKLILIQGTSSRLMNGDPLYRTNAVKKARYRFNPDEVLPFLLSTGWAIKSVYMNEPTYADVIYGYVVVEKINSAK